LRHGHEKTGCANAAGLDSQSKAAGDYWPEPSESPSESLDDAFAGAVELLGAIAVPDALGVIEAELDIAGFMAVLASGVAAG
jgi:hypothetical protein